LPDFEILDEVDCNKKQEAEKEDSKKYRKVPSLASDTLIANKKTIISFVGPSKLYLVMKGMKLDDTEVKTNTFLRRVSQLDIERYMARRPNVMKVIMDSYGPVSCTWSAFDGVRKNLTSFMVRSGNAYIDMCDFITL
jgi:hypothetical protein